MSLRLLGSSPPQPASYCFLGSMVFAGHPSMAFLLESFKSYFPDNLARPGVLCPSDPFVKSEQASGHTLPPGGLLCLGLPPSIVLSGDGGFSV